MSNAFYSNDQVLKAVREAKELNEKVNRELVRLKEQRISTNVDSGRITVITDGVGEILTVGVEGLDSSTTTLLVSALKQSQMRAKEAYSHVFEGRI